MRKDRVFCILSKERSDTERGVGRRLLQVEQVTIADVRGLIGHKLHQLKVDDLLE